MHGVFHDGGNGLRYGMEQEKCVNRGFIPSSRSKMTRDFPNPFFTTPYPHLHSPRSSYRSAELSQPQPSHRSSAQSISLPSRHPQNRMPLRMRNCEISCMYTMLVPGSGGEAGELPNSFLVLWTHIDQPRGGFMVKHHGTHILLHATTCNTGLGFRQYCQASCWDL